MKKVIISIMLALAAMAGQAQVKCHIEGELRDTTQGKTIIICPAGMDLRVSNNYISNNYITEKADEQGRFSCDVETDKMTLYNVFLYEQYEQSSWANTNFLVENDATVTLRFDEGQWKVVSGGREQTLKLKMEAEADLLYCNKMDDIDRQIEVEVMSKVEELRAQGKNPEEDSSLVKRYDKYQEEYEKLYHAYRAWELEYYAAHPIQYALYDMANQMLYNNIRHDEQKQKIMSLYHNVYENFHPENPIHNTIRTLEAAWLLKPGKPYHDFEVRTLEGKKVQVSSLYRGKVALIDFWASWCGPCRQHSKAMIPVYEKYKDKGFTVVAIARENEPKDMIRAARKDGYPWQSLIDIKDEMSVWQKNGLGLSGGGMFLIDRDGTILSTSTEAEELEPLIKKAHNIE